MRPYVQVNTLTAAATTSTQSSAPTSAAVPTTTDTTAISERPLHSGDVSAHHLRKCDSHSVFGGDDQGVIKSYSKRRYDDAKKAFLNYSPSDNYVYSNVFVNKSKLPSFASSQQQQQRTQSLWSTHLPEPTQPKCCIDSTSTTPTTTVMVLPSDNQQQKYSNAEQSTLISDKNLSLLSSTASSFDTAYTPSSSTSNQSTNRLSPVAVNANSKTTDGCEVNRVKFVHCDNRFVDARSLHVGAENEKNSGNAHTTSPMLQNRNNAINDIQNNYCAQVVTPMSNSLNSSNCETISKCQNSSNSDETTALLTGNVPSKSITVRKAGNTALIFTKKDSNPVVHRKKNVYLRTTSNDGRSTLATPSVDPAGDSSSSYRHSFHWQDNSGISSEDRKRKQVKSWYAIISPNEIADETIEERYLNYNNLAGTKEINAKASHETAALLEQPQVHQSWRVGGKQHTASTIRPSNINEMVSNGRETSKYNRFEQLLKNLVGRKVSREVVTPNASSKMSTTTASSPTAPSSFSRQSSTISEDDAPTLNRKSSGDDTDAKSNHLLFSSSEIQCTPSATNLLRRGDHLLVESASASTTSLNSTVQRKLWNVMPLLRREDSCTSLYQNSTKPLLHQLHNSPMSGLKKCDTVLTLSHSQTTPNFEPIKPQNRLRHSQTIAMCSRCSSILSLAANGSRYSLNLANGGGFIAINNNNTAAGSNAGGSEKATSSAAISCKLCLCDANDENITTIQQCGCKFCTDCMKSYVEFEIQEGAYDISCPDALCPGQGILSITNEISTLVTPEFLERYKRFRLNREIELDQNRTWCPRAGCETVCVVGPTSAAGETAKMDPQPITITSSESIPVKCPTCVEEFCSSCKKSWHLNMTCEENARRLAASGIDDSIGISFDTDLIKCCPMCGVPIEKDEGCAQMMCKRCKHVFCWYCLASLDDDFLLRHYDKGPCKNKLGHSRASVVWHRAQVIGIFAGFGLLLLVASPLLLLAAPCIVCCKCRICSSSTKLEDADADFDDANR